MRSRSRCACCGRRPAPSDGQKVDLKIGVVVLGWMGLCLAAVHFDALETIVTWAIGP